MITRRSLPLLGAVVALAVLAVALASGLGEEPLEPGVETGVVVAVDAAGLTDVRGFSLRTGDGRTIDFRIGRLENAAEFPPAHLSVHLADAYSVRVTYEMDGAQRVAVRLEDGDPSP